MSNQKPLFRKIDSYQLPVSDLDDALDFYCQKLGHTLIWRTEAAAGLQLPDSDAEIVLQTERPDVETDILVDSVDGAVERFVAAGGRLLRGPFKIQIGMCAVVADPFANVLVLLDLSRGHIVTDEERRVVGNELA